MYIQCPLSSVCHVQPHLQQAMRSGLSFSLTSLHTTFSLDFLVLLACHVSPLQQGEQDPTWMTAASRLAPVHTQILIYQQGWDLFSKKCSFQLLLTTNTILILPNILINSHPTRSIYWISSYNLIPLPGFCFSFPKFPAPCCPNWDVFIKTWVAENIIYIYIWTPLTSISTHMFKIWNKGSQLEST